MRHYCLVVGTRYSSVSTRNATSTNSSRSRSDWQKSTRICSTSTRKSLKRIRTSDHLTHHGAIGARLPRSVRQSKMVVMWTASSNSDTCTVLIVKLFDTGNKETTVNNNRIIKALRIRREELHQQLIDIHDALLLFEPDNLPPIVHRTAAEQHEQAAKDQLSTDGWK